MAQELSETDIFVLLAKRRRRSVLQELQDTATPVSAVELAKCVGEREYQDLSAEKLRTVFVSLHHTHLPKLEEFDVVVYDSNDGTVRPGSNFDRLVRTLRGASDRDESWAGN